MSLPKFEQYILPSLIFFSQNHNLYSYKEQMAFLVDYFHLTEADCIDKLECGQLRLYNYTTWADNYLMNAGLIQRIGRGKHSITDAGRAFLKSNPVKITLAQIKKLRNQFEKQNSSEEKPEKSIESINETPDEMIEMAFATIQNNLKRELLELIVAQTPDFFEKLVVELLEKMGYGGFKDCSKVVGKSGDGGIDGIIKQDKLGLDTIFIQAKKYALNHSVPKEEVCSFYGVLAKKRKVKGVFITTSGFTKNTLSEYKEDIVLIDGNRLADLMIEYNLGVEIKHHFDVKKIDRSFFETEEDD